MSNLKLKKSFQMGNIVGSHRDIWFTNVRPQLQKLMFDNPDGHIVVLTMLFVWIDVLYVIQNCGCEAAMSGDARNKYTTRNIIEWFFPSVNQQEQLKERLIGLANSLKHSGFPRENIVFSDYEYMRLSELGKEHNQWGEMQIKVSHIANFHYKGDHLVIHPTEFYIFARNKIDKMLIDAEIED